MFVSRIVKELLSRPVPSYSPLAHACSISTRSRCCCLRTLDRPSVRQPDYQSCSLWISCTYHHWNFDSTALRPQVRIPPINFFQHQHGNFVTFWQPGPPSLTDKVRNDWRSRLKPFCACISSRYRQHRQPVRASSSMNQRCPTAIFTPFIPWNASCSYDPVFS